MRESEVRITPSIIDRLIDYDPKVSTEAPKSRSRSLQELKISVRRDLEWLLNTRHKSGKIAENLEHVEKSIATFGLPDFTGTSSKSFEDRKMLIRNVETALRNFEPRFINLKVTLEEAVADRGVRFRIQATLRVEPTPEPVVFDTILQMGSGEFEIKEV